MTRPFMSIVMTVGDREELLARALFGVLRQVSPRVRDPRKPNALAAIDDWELLIYADGHQPHAAKIVDDFRRMHPQRAAAIAYETADPVPGTWGNLNRRAGLEKARGEYTCFLSHDCQIQPHYLRAHARNVADGNGQPVLSLVSILSWLTKRAENPEVDLDMLHYAGKIPRRGKDPAALKFGQVDLTCMAVPTREALEADVFAAAHAGEYAADFSQLYARLVNRIAVRYNPEIVGAHF